MNSTKNRVSPMPKRHIKVERNPMWLRGSGQLKKIGGKFKNNNNNNNKIYITLYFMKMYTFFFIWVFVLMFCL